ncbi:MAG: hypothetical protein QOI12_1629 [Alphaproteobacteria bacterium]|jgi:hypothetical protein|nr:hypothetical protein [Alphaproteobacteria bacterium]
MVSPAPDRGQQPPRTLLQRIVVPVATKDAELWRICLLPDPRINLEPAARLRHYRMPLHPPLKCVP